MANRSVIKAMKVAKRIEKQNAATAIRIRRFGSSLSNIINKQINENS